MLLLLKLQQRISVLHHLLLRLPNNIFQFRERVVASSEMLGDWDYFVYYIFHQVRIWRFRYLFNTISKGLCCKLFSAPPQDHLTRTKNLQHLSLFFFKAFFPDNLAFSIIFVFAHFVSFYSFYLPYSKWFKDVFCSVILYSWFIFLFLPFPLWNVPNIRRKKKQKKNLRIYLKCNCHPCVG